MLPRLLSGILAAVFLPLGVAFTSIEVFYDPQEPSNFEPVASVQRTLFAA